jgi:hypothetical protein
MVLDFQKFSKKATDRVFDYFDVFTDGKYPKKFRKFLEWYGYKFQPVFLSFASTLILFWIFLRVFDRIGFEKTIIILMVLIIITIRTLKNK